MIFNINAAKSIKKPFCFIVLEFNLRLIRLDYLHDCTHKCINCGYVLYDIILYAFHDLARIRESEQLYRGELSLNNSRPTGLSYGQGSDMFI